MNHQEGRNMQQKEAGRQAADLRKQALALLEQASQLDGLKPYLVTHRHESGTSVYLATFDHEPSESEAVDALTLDFEPARDEELDVDPIPLHKLVGIEPASPNM